LKSSFFALTRLGDPRLDHFSYSSLFLFLFSSSVVYLFPQNMIRMTHYGRGDVVYRHHCNSDWASQRRFCFFDRSTGLLFRASIGQGRGFVGWIYFARAALKTESCFTVESINTNDFVFFHSSDLVSILIVCRVAMIFHGARKMIMNMLFVKSASYSYTHTKTCRC
jgi:hypothetical protein